MAPRAFITDLSGQTLTPEERAFLRDTQPWGLILFKRNVETPDQVRGLLAGVRDALGRNAPVLVDQEGGRIQRLGPPHWPAYPPGRAYGRLFDRDPAQGIAAARLGAQLIASDLHALGIDVDCLPLADVPVGAADPVIGDRAYGETAEKVSALARAAADGLRLGGVLPVLKHLPGHGRATADSHTALPVVRADRQTLESSDFAAFRPLAELPMGMTAHVVFAAIDAVAPVTTSATMIREVIRGWIGFEGLLMSDDVSMGALSGSVGARSRAAVAAGCDIVLHCNGSLPERYQVAEAVPVLQDAAGRRAAAALALRNAPAPLDVAAARSEFRRLLATVEVEVS